VTNFINKHQKLQAMARNYHVGADACRSVQNVHYSGLVVCREAELQIRGELTITCSVIGASPYYKLRSLLLPFCSADQTIFDVLAAYERKEGFPPPKKQGEPLDSRRVPFLEAIVDQMFPDLKQKLAISGPVKKRGPDGRKIHLKRSKELLDLLYQDGATGYVVKGILYIRPDNIGNAKTRIVQQRIVCPGLILPP